jgi:SPOR domain
VQAQQPQQRVAAIPAPLNQTGAAPAPAVPKRVPQAALPTKKPRDDVAATGGSALGAADVPPTPAVRKPTGAGFMAVLSLQKTEIDAMRVFADLQQKHPSLQGKTPIAQPVEANSKYAGMYRLMVGPPGSFASAKEMCTQLQPAGIKDCYPMPY